MKKAFLLLTMCFVMCGLLASCSKDEKKKGKSNSSTVTILIDGNVPVNDKVELYSNQTIRLDVVMTDKKGDVVNDHTAVWSNTSGLGSLNSSTSKTAYFTAASQGSFSNASIKVDCVETGKSMISKSIKVTFYEFIVSLLCSTPHIIPYNVNSQLKVDEILTSRDASNAVIVWSAKESGGQSNVGYFSPATTAIGETTTYYQPEGFVGTVYLTVSVAGLGEDTCSILTFYDPSNPPPDALNALNKRGFQKLSK